MEIDDTDDISILNSDSLPPLDGDETNKIRLLLTAEDDVAHDCAWHKLPHEHRLKIKGIDFGEKDKGSVAPKAQLENPIRVV